MDSLDLDKKDVVLINALGEYHKWVNTYLTDVDIYSSPLMGDKTWERFVLTMYKVFIAFDERIKNGYSRNVVDRLIDMYGRVAFNVSVGLTAIGETEKSISVLLLGKKTYMKMATKYDDELIRLFNNLNAVEELEEESKRKQIAKEDSSGEYFKAAFFIILIILAIKFFMS